MTTQTSTMPTKVPSWRVTEIEKFDELVNNELKAQGVIVTWHDPVVKSWQGVASSELGGSEIAIVVTLHDVMDRSAVKTSAPYVFDTTGKLIGVKGL
mgnify:CR=1 FL=1